MYDEELALACDEQLKVRVRYTMLYALLKRVCIDKTKEFSTDFSGLFARLYAVCKHYNLPHAAADRFRRNALQTLRGQREASEELFATDVADLRSFLEALEQGEGGNEEPAPTEVTPPVEQLKVARGLVKERVGDDAFTLLLQDNAGEILVKTDAETLELLEEGMRVNVVNGGELVILEPDFLIDVSALTACVKPYGTSPLNYLLAQLQPRQTTRAILLGNAANQFMDDCTNTAEVNFAESMQTHFRQSLLDYACFEGPEEINVDYFKEARQHFENIHRIVHQAYASPEVGIALDKVLLEPAFICATLGLRGRLDVMTADHRHIVELKSGKAEDFRSPVRPREEHVLQMALYKEMLHFNFSIPRDAIASFLLYSRYPTLLDERIPRTKIKEVMHLRNEIVRMEMRMRNGEVADVLSELTYNNIIQKQGLHPNFLKAILPPIQAVVEPLTNASSLERSYFNHFMTILSREQFLSKMGEPRPDSTRGFARVWNADYTSKLLSGEILINLRIRELLGEGGVEEIIFDVPDYGEKFIADFNEGAMVQLYERRSATDTVCNRQLVRAYIVRLTDTELHLHLSYKQRNRDFFSKDTLYAIEKDSTDSSFQSARRGLFSLLTAPQERRDLLLCRRAPRFDTNIQLCGDYGARTNAIVLPAMQAQDYYLLVGPPGTGKTNVALRAMVQEFLTSACLRGERPNLLLAAYTNRAVDEICQMLQCADIDFLRLGIEQTCTEAVHKNLFQNQAAALKNRAEVSQLLLDHQVIVGTVATLTSHTELFNLKQFDLLILDEASQVLEPQIMGLLAHPHAVRRFIMIGDHKQLPAVVMQRTEQTIVRDEALRSIGLTDLRNSLFERLHGFVSHTPEVANLASGLLSLQGRMHREIAQFVNERFYDGRLSVVPLEHQEEALNYTDAQTPMEQFVATTRMGFVHVSAPDVSDNVKANKKEAEVVANIVEALIQLNERSGTPLSLPKQLGIIVPFRNQISMVRASLRTRGVPDVDNITIDTVECFQGSQRDYIIFTTTISRPYQLDILSVCQHVGETEVDRKLNVAITRARKQFFLVGNRDLLSRNALYADLIKRCEQA